jgi:hypothetical protein
MKLIKLFSKKLFQKNNKLFFKRFYTKMSEEDTVLLFINLIKKVKTKTRSVFSLKL